MEDVSHTSLTDVSHGEKQWQADEEHISKHRPWPSQKHCPSEVWGNQAVPLKAVEREPPDLHQSCRKTNVLEAQTELDITVYKRRHAIDILNKEIKTI